jgi:hypothetical protein
MVGGGREKLGRKRLPISNPKETLKLKLLSFKLLQDKMHVTSREIYM